MRVLFQKKTALYVGIFAIALLLSILYIRHAENKNEQGWITTVVDTGTVTELVSVSGVVEAQNTARLSFPTTGVVNGVFVEEGDIVEDDMVLATLATDQLVAEREKAFAALSLAQAEYDELRAGRTATDRALTDEEVAAKEVVLENTIRKENEKVENARVLLYSQGLEALAIEPNERAETPTVSGSYTCNETGSYTLTLYRSNAPSGHSYRLEGLETGTFSAYSENPAPLGSCGLYIQFSPSDDYHNSVWEINIPNTKSNAYTANKNAYELARTTRDAAIREAEDAVAIAYASRESANADPRSEALRRSDASVENARAALREVEARMRDRSILAPFEGIITEVDVIPGEVAATEPVITLLKEDSFKIVARIPEIDISKVGSGQHVSMRFDAATSEMVDGIITFVSPLAVEIDGVAYFEATIRFADELPQWIKAGLNADVDIVVHEEEDALRIPKRFLTKTENDSPAVLVPQGDARATKEIGVLFDGNDGYVAITGLSEGATVIAP